MSGSSLKVQHIGNTFGFAASSLAFELVDELQHIDVNKIYQELSCKDGSLASFPKGENDVRYVVMTLILLGRFFVFCAQEKY